MVGGRKGGQDGLHSLQPLHGQGGVPGEAGPDVVLSGAAELGQVQHLTGERLHGNNTTVLGLGGECSVVSGHKSTTLP